MRTVAFSRRAERDLKEIADWIAADNEDAADRVVDEIEGAVALLAQVPGMGHARRDVADATLRFWPVYSYVIAYRHTSRTLTVVRVVHGARDFRKLFGRAR